MTKHSRLPMNRMVERTSAMWNKPRDPARIGPVLEALAEVWRAQPDLRLGQLITIAAGQNDVFNIEEDKLVAGLQGLGDRK